MVLTGDEMQQIIGLIILCSMIYGAFYAAKSSRSMYGKYDMLDCFAGAVIGFAASVITILMLSLVAALCLGAL